jgi:hypothetical protein
VNSCETRDAVPWHEDVRVVRKFGSDEGDGGAGDLGETVAKCAASIREAAIRESEGLRIPKGKRLTKKWQGEWGAPEGSRGP